MNVESSSVCVLAIIIIAGDAIIATGLKNVDATSFMNIVALSTIFTSILDNIKFKIADWQYFASLKNELLQETSLFEEIMHVHDQQKEEEEAQEVVLKPFVFSYEGGNFSLKNEKMRSFNKGEMILLKGDSGQVKVHF